MSRTAASRPSRSRRSSSSSTVRIRPTHPDKLPAHLSAGQHLHRKRPPTISLVVELPSLGSVSLSSPRRIPLARRRRRTPLASLSHRAPCSAPSHPRRPSVRLNSLRPACLARSRRRSVKRRRAPPACSAVRPRPASAPARRPRPPFPLRPLPSDRRSLERLAALVLVSTAQ